jgi:hypothetical protein
MGNFSQTHLVTLFLSLLEVQVPEEGILLKEEEEEE